MVKSPQEDSSLMSQQPKLPSMNLEHVSLSLRYTCEMNRRLQGASQLKPSIHDQYDLPAERTASSQLSSLSRGGQMVQIHPSQYWQQPIRETTKSERLVEEQLTLFHAKTPREGKHKVRRGASRWGPDMLLYLKHVTKALKVQDNPLVLSLAILYLDRASSVETPRSNGAPACPYVSPRTVHRLVLVSLIIATKAVYPNVDLKGLASLGISETQLGQMEHWMRAALGDQGLYVMPEQLQEFFGHWERTWNKPKIRVKSKRMRRKLVRPAQPQSQVEPPPPMQQKEYYQQHQQQEYYRPQQQQQQQYYESAAAPTPMQPQSYYSAASATGPDYKKQYHYPDSSANTAVSDAALSLWA